MNKKLLSLAVATGVAGLAGVSAHAVDFTSATPTPVYVASEFEIGTGATIVDPSVTGTFAAGFSIDDTNERYIRFDLSAGTWGATQLDGALSVNDSAGATAVEARSAGGATTDNYVIYAVTASATNSVAPDDDVKFTPSGGISVTAGSGVNITYQLFETAAAAVANAGGALATDSGSFISFTAGNTTAVESVTTNPIDVTVGTATGAVFASAPTNTTIIGQINTTDSVLAPINDTGTTATTAAMVATDSLVVTGDFTFAQDLTSSVPDGTYTAANVYIDSATNDCSTSSTAATSLTATTATFTNPGLAANTSHSVCVIANGVSLIAEQTFTGTYATTGNTGYADESNGLTLGTLAKNGANDNVNLVLNPDGVFKNYLRVVNTSNIAGDVTFQVYNDAGDTVTGIAMADIAGQSSSSLSGQASSGLIDVADLYDAAVAADATFDVDGGKLRVFVTGNFGGVELQNITVSTDNTTFATF
jgi:hypothetical protein